MIIPELRFEHLQSDGFNDILVAWTYIGEEQWVCSESVPPFVGPIPGGFLLRAAAKLQEVKQQLEEAHERGSHP